MKRVYRALMYGLVILISIGAGGAFIFWYVLCASILSGSELCL